MAFGASGSEKSPIKFPEIAVSEWVVSIIVRAVVPLGIALYVAAPSWVADAVPFLRPLPELANSNLAGVVASGCAVWFAHWVYVMVRRSNPDLKEDHRLLVWGLRVAFFYAVMWVIVRVCVLNAAFAAGGYPGVWDEFAGLTRAALAQSGIGITALFVPLVHLASVLFRCRIAQAEPSEGLWWIDALARIVRTAAYIVAALAVITSSAILASYIDDEVPLWFSGSWWAGALDLVLQLYRAGTLWVLAAMAACYALLARLSLWRDVRRERTERASAAPLASNARIASLIGILKAVVWAALFIALAATLMAVSNPESPDARALFSLLRTMLLPPSAIAPLIGIVAWWLLRSEYKRWRDGGRCKPAFVRALAWLASAIVIAALVFAFLYGVGVAAQGQSGVAYSLLKQQVDYALAQPNIWGLTLSCLVALVVAVVIVAIMGVIAIALFAGGGAGEGGAGGAGGGGGGGAVSSFGGAGARATVRDRYGAKLAKKEDFGILGTKVTDGCGSVIGDVREGLSGISHVRMGDSTFEVRDAALGSDRIVSKDGEEVGRIHESAVGGDPWYEDTKH